jgi:hypothetical protein
MNAVRVMTEDGRRSLMRHVNGGRRSLGKAGCRLNGEEESWSCGCTILINGDVHVV